MALTKWKASILSISIYLVVCWTGAFIIMSIEYKSLKEHRVPAHQKLNLTSQLQEFLWKRFSINMNASSTEMILEEITNCMKVDYSHTSTSWKKEFSFTTFRKWKHFITSTMTTVGEKALISKNFSNVSYATIRIMIINSCCGSLKISKC